MLPPGRTFSPAVRLNRADLRRRRPPGRVSIPVSHDAPSDRVTSCVLCETGSPLPGASLPALAPGPVSDQGEQFTVENGAADHRRLAKHSGGKYWRRRAQPCARRFLIFGRTGFRCRKPYRGARPASFRLRTTFSIRRRESSRTGASGSRKVSPHFPIIASAAFTGPGLRSQWLTSMSGKCLW